MDNQPNPFATNPPRAGTTTPNSPTAPAGDAAAVGEREAGRQLGDDSTEPRGAASVSQRAAPGGNTEGGAVNTGPGASGRPSGTNQ